MKKLVQGEGWLNFSLAKIINLKTPGLFFLVIVVLMA
jgi:hypothetical protein